MPALPPTEMLWDVALYAMLIPAIVAAATVAAAARVVPHGKQFAAGALGVAAGFLAGNFFRHVVDFRIAPDRPLSFVDLALTMWRALAAFDGDAGRALPPARVWLPWVCLVAAAAGIVDRAPRIPSVARWLIGILAMAIGSRLLVPPALEVETPWLWPVLACVLLANWKSLDAVDRRAPANWLPLGIAGVFMAAAAVLIHAHTARFTDVATILAGAWFGIAVAGRGVDANRDGSHSIAAIALPGLMLIAQQSTFSDVPTAAFVLVGLAPIALAPLAVVPVRYRATWRFAVAGWALLLTPAVVAIVLAARAETVVFE